MPKDHTRWVDCLLLLLAVFVPYSQVAGHQFIEFDDGAYIYENLHVIGGLTWDNIAWAFTAVEMNVGNWHPLTWLSILADRELFGPYPGGYLLMNVAWHGLASCLCYLAFRRFFSSRWSGLMIAVFFALHPVNVENVAWYSERKSILDAVFWFAGILCYLEWRKARRFLFYSLILLTHILGLMSKPMHITFPCALLLIHLGYQYMEGWRRQWQWHVVFHESVAAMRWLVPMFVISALAGIMTMHAQVVALYPIDSYSLSSRLINVVLSYGRYLRMMFYPTEFAVFYPLMRDELRWASALPVGCFCFFITAFAFLFVRRLPFFLLGWLWYLGTMVPVIGFVHVGSQSHADRYLYIPMLGLCFIWPVLDGFMPRIASNFRYFYLFAVAASLATLTYIQVGYWATGSRLFSHSLTVTGDCMTSVTVLINSYLRGGDFKSAIAVSEAKLAIAQNPINRARLHFFLAKGNYAAGHTKEALLHVDAALAGGLVDQEAYIFQGFCRLDLGDRLGAAESCAKAQSTMPDLLIRGLALESCQKRLQWLEAALKKEPHP